jgi:hypothetical protein
MNSPSAPSGEEDSRLRATNDLSVALLRCLSVKRIFEDEFAALRAEGATVANLQPIPFDSLEPNRKTRAAAMVFLYYATLYVIVEGWMAKRQPKPKLKDERVDSLLSDSFVKVLKDFRNAISHPNSAVDPRILDFHTSHRELGVWAGKLCAEFQRYFIEWRESVGFPSQRRN